MSPQYDRIDLHGGAQSSPAQIRSQLDTLLTDSDVDTVDWNVVNGLLQSLPIDKASPEIRYASTQDDPMGRLLMAGILARNPPPAIVDTAIHIFPECLNQNPCAFVIASQHASKEVLTRMIRYVVSSKEEQCPYPWILSELVSSEAAKTVLEACPRGVWMPSSLLSSHNLLDYFLMSPEVVKCRTFDQTLWTKFKLVLVAAGCSDKEIPKSCRCEVAPVQVILKRVLSRPDFWTDRDRVEHVLWLLHQLRWTDRWVFEKPTPDGMYPIHTVLSRRCTSDQGSLVAARALVQLLLEAHPASAALWVGGKLALHLAVENGWPCHDLLLAAHPDALDAPDPSTELFPFQAAAKHHLLSSSPISLDMTYELLRANPNHARGGVRERTSLRVQG